MVVRVCFRVLRQFQFRHDLVDDSLVFEDAAVSEQRESPGLRVEHYTPTGRVVILHISGYEATALISLPDFIVTRSVNQEITIRLSLTERRAVDHEFAADDPKDADEGFSLRMRCSLMNFDGHPHSLVRP